MKEKTKLTIRIYVDISAALVAHAGSSLFGFLVIVALSIGSTGYSIFNQGVVVLFLVIEWMILRKMFKRIERLKELRGKK